MEKAIYVTLPEGVITALVGVSKGNVSQAMREMLQDYDAGEVAKFLDVGRAGCRIDKATEAKLRDEAEKFGVPTARLVRAIIESKLTHH